MIIGARFIPAGAGNMGPAEPAPWLLPVYPRWRGEHELINLTISCAFGLSPLARGTYTQSLNTIRDERFIPAGAGNMQIVRIRSPSDNGLSPLARGTSGELDNVDEDVRFIPAGAGNIGFR